MSQNKLNPQPIIIAEAGVNHNGSLDLALKMVDIAANAGVSYIKFQTFKTEMLVTESAEKAKYQKITTGECESQFEMLKKLELSKSAFSEIFQYCKKKGIGFLSTPFDIKSAEFLVDIGMEKIKVSSGDLTNLPFIRQLGSMNIPVILSTGMANMGDIEIALEGLLKAGMKLDDIGLLHCTTEYPAPFLEVNLRAIATMKLAFPGIKIGYSDHTKGIEISLAAVALGAEIIEKHFTLDRGMEGPDHKASIEAKELGQLVRSIGNIYNALGSGAKKPSISEIPNIQIARKSIVAGKCIKKGEKFSNENLTTKRPGSGISPIHWDSIIGKEADRYYIKDQLIEI